MRYYISLGFWAAFFVVCFPTSLPAAFPGDFLARVHTEPGTGIELPYRLFQPLDYDPAQKYPLILYFHGAGERGTDNLAQINYNIDNLLAHAKMPEYSSFLLAPQTPLTWFSFSEDLSDDGAIADSTRLTLDVIEQLKVEFNIDVSSIYITGISMGASGVWDISARRPELFAATLPICHGGYASTGPAFVDRPVWAFHAVDDGTVSVNATRRMINAIRDAGGNPLYTEYATGGHAIWPTVYNTTEVYDWLFSQHLVVPEPTGLSLMAGGAIGIGCFWVRRRCRKRKSVR